RSSDLIVIELAVESCAVNVGHGKSGSEFYGLLITFLCFVIKPAAAVKNSQINLSLMSISIHLLSFDIFIKSIFQLLLCGFTETFRMNICKDSGSFQAYNFGLVFQQRQ